MAAHRLFLPLATIAAVVLFLVAMSVSDPVDHVKAAVVPERESDHNHTRRGAWRGRGRRHRRRFMGDRWQPLPEGTSVPRAQATPPNVSIVEPVAIEEEGDPICHTAVHTGYSGDGATVWGMGFKLPSAAECCRACKAHAAMCGKPESEGKQWWPADDKMRCSRRKACSIWTFCPEVCPHSHRRRGHQPPPLPSTATASTATGPARDRRFQVISVPTCFDCQERCFAFDVHKHTRGECWLKYQEAQSVSSTACGCVFGRRRRGRRRGCQSVRALVSKSVTPSYCFSCALGGIGVPSQVNVLIATLNCRSPRESGSVMLSQPDQLPPRITAG